MVNMPFFFCLDLYFVRSSIFYDQLFDILSDFQNFMDADATFIALVFLAAAGL